MAAFSSLHFGVSMRLFRDHQQQKVEAFKAFEAGSGDQITHLTILTKYKVTASSYVVIKFFGGSSDKNEKVLGKFLARLRRAKKGVPKFFACSGLLRCGGTENR